MKSWINAPTQLLGRLKTMMRSVAQKNTDDRRAMSFNEFHDRYFASSGIDRQLVEELLNLIASEVGVQPERIRATDRFAVELSPGKWNDWDSGEASLMHILDARVRAHRLVIQGPVETVDDYIRAMAAVYPDP